MVTEIDDYPWSSHLAYKGKLLFPWLTTTYIQNLLSKHTKEMDQIYEKFICNRDTYYKKPEFIHLDANGDIVITDSVNDKINYKKSLNFSGIALQQIINVVCDYMQIKQEQLSSVSYNKKLTICLIVVI